MKHVYADWAATAPLHPAAKDVLLSFMKAPCPSNPSSIHAFGIEAAKRLDKARTNLQNALRWDGQVVFTSGGTESDGIAVLSLLRQYQNTNRRRILLSPFEHPAVRETVYAYAPAMGFTIEECTATSDGSVDPKDFAARLDDDVAFAAVLAVQNETGVIQPVDKLAKMTHDCGGAFLSDCVQAVGHIPLPKEPDILTLSGHKFGGPGGTGALLAKPGVILSPLLKGGGQEGGIRGGTENVMGICAMVAAAEAVTKTGEPGWMGYTRDQHEDEFLDEMANFGIPVSIAGRGANRIGSISCVVFGGKSAVPESENLVLSCDMAGLAVSAGSACHSGERTPSATLLAMGYTAEEALRQVRLSFGWSTQLTTVKHAYDLLHQTLLNLWQPRFEKESDREFHQKDVWEDMDIC